MKTLKPLRRSALAAIANQFVAKSLRSSLRTALEVFANLFKTKTLRSYLRSTATITLSLTLLAPQQTTAQTSFDFSGSVTSDTLWDADIVRVFSDVRIFDSVTLTIAPGTRVEFQNYHDIIVAGRLIAEGTANDSIVFTIHDTTGYHTDSISSGGWGGILWDDTTFGEWGEMADNDTSKLSHCIIEYVKGIRDYGDSERWESGGIVVQHFSKLLIEHSQIRYCKSTNTGGGILVAHHARPVIRHNYIHHNEAPTGGGVSIGYANPVIHHNLISHNGHGTYTMGSGAGVFISSSDVVFEHNEVSYNKYSLDGGGLMLIGSNCLIRNNDIHNNEARNGAGLYYTNKASPTIINNRFYLNYGGYGGAIFLMNTSGRIISNLIFNNQVTQHGGAIFMNTSDPLVLNNTIVNHQARYGGAIYIATANASIVNNIIWNSTAVGGDQFFVDNNYLNPTIEHNVIQDGLAGFFWYYPGDFSGVYENNLESDPQFEDPVTGIGIVPLPGSYDWEISSTSPCLNQGKHEGMEPHFPEFDLEGDQRVRYGTVDLGALERQIPAITAGGMFRSDTSLMADTIFINDDLIIADSFQLDIALGSTVRFLGHYEIEVRGSLTAKGSSEIPILFTMHDTTGFSDHFSTNGGWQGIRVDNSGFGMAGAMHDNAGSVLDHCIIEYVKTELDTWAGRAPVSVQYFDDLKVSNCTIRNNVGIRGSAGVYGYYSRVNICDNHFENNRIREGSNYNSGGALLLSSCHGNIHRNTFRNNHAERMGGGLMSEASRLSVRNNLFDANTCDMMGAPIYTSYSRDTLVNNIISNNHADDMVNLYFDRSTILMIGNLVCNNNQGIRGNVTDLTLVNNTIVNNQKEGVRVADGNLTMLNNIISGNEHQVLIYNPYNETLVTHCLVDGGMIGIEGIWDGQVTNIFDGQPHFKSPSGGVGTGFAGLEADFSLLSFSPAVNASLPDPSGKMPPTDLLGQPRLHDLGFDLGAIENQDDPPVITRHPFGGYFCEGDTLKLYAIARDTALYQWMHGDSLLGGMDHPTLTLAGLSSGDEGNYYCRISNAYDTLETVPAFINVNAGPEINADPLPVHTVAGRNEVFSVYSSGEELEFQWFHDGVVVPDQTFPEYRFEVEDSTGEGFFHCVVTNNCGSDTSEAAPVWLVPQICMVTVSPTTGKNLVVWEKNSRSPVLAYHIYRESVAAGIYDRLATIPYDELSVFTDTSADPTVQAYLYKITALDGGGEESGIDLCLPHKTIHLIVSTNPELKTTQLQWDKYFGFDYQTYTIYKSTTGMNFDPVHSLSASLNSWTDPVASSGDLFYRMAVEKPDPCVPGGGGKKSGTGYKAGTGPYVHSLSNMDDNKLKEGQLPPDTITISNSSIEEGNLPGAFIGKLLTADADSLDSHTYKFVPGDGADDNHSFTLSGDLLLASETFDYETKNAYSVRIRSTDEAGNFYEMAFTIMILEQTTGIGGITAANRVRVYPNPFSESTTLKFPNPEHEAYKLVLTDLSGKVSRVIDGIYTSEIVLKRGDLRPGLYFLELRGPGVYRGKIIIE